MYMGVLSKLAMNMHDLNNERAEEIRRVPVIYHKKDGSWLVVEEAVAVSGVMVKHWHFRYLVELGSNHVPFCDYCSKMEAIRVPSGGLETELDLIKRCAGEDIHGFLRAKPPLRRESLSRFSWMLPLPVGEVMDGFGLPTPFRVVQHTRNVREIPEGAPDEVRQAQMPYPRSYSSGIYGLVSSLDLVHIGHSFTGQKDLDKPARLKRRKLAVQSYVPLLTGSGASLARALPISELLEVITIISEKPIPTPIHPIYPGYYEDNIALYRGVSKALACKATMYVWSKERSVQSTGDGAFKLEETKEPAEPFHKIIEEWMKS